MIARRSSIASAISFLPLTADDMADIHGRFAHANARSFAADLRDLRLAQERVERFNKSEATRILSLRSLFPNNIG